MTRTRITTTDDTDVPRVAHMGGGIVWYAYRRSANKGLYVQRAVAGVPGPETLIAAPVDYIDMVVDPDGTRAWIYFTCDGALRAIEVTDKTEALGTLTFQRGQGWQERVEGTLGGVVLSDSGFIDLQTAEYRTDDSLLEVYPPVLELLEGATPSQQILKINESQINIGRVAKFRVYRLTDIAGAGWQFWSDVSYSGSGYSVLTVPTPASPNVWAWAATAIRAAPLTRESAWSNIVYSNNPFEAILGSWGGAVLDVDVAFVDKTPVKYGANDSYAPGRFGGAVLDVETTYVDKTPVKRSANDSYTPGRFGGAVLSVSFTLNGIDPIAP